MTVVEASTAYSRPNRAQPLPDSTAIIESVGCDGVAARSVWPRR